jgi:hypothetical protein
MLMVLDKEERKPGWEALDKDCKTVFAQTAKTVRTQRRTE